MNLHKDAERLARRDGNRPSRRYESIVWALASALLIYTVGLGAYCWWSQ